jgi:hypothetical protein
MKAKLIAVTAALALCGLAFAQPSEYYLWQNKKTGEKVCDPQAASADWVKLSGPYEDPSCSVPIRN